jgi:hypothetical protein
MTTRGARRATHRIELNLTDAGERTSTDTSSGAGTRMMEIGAIVEHWPLARE